MKINLNILSAGLLLATAVSFSSCDDFLTRDPQDTVTDVPSFWNNEENLRTSFLDYYTYFFPGYRSSWERADNFAETNVADWTDATHRKWLPCSPRWLPQVMLATGTSRRSVT